MGWLASIDEEELFLSVVSLAELRHGIGGKRRTALELWLTDQLRARFNSRLLSIDAATADLWGHVVAQAQSTGRPVSAMDAFLAATAKQHQLTLVTRNTSDFEATGVRLFNPWMEEA